MRRSRPMPRATSPTSAPTSSQTLAISLTKEIFVARKALEASLIISALATSVRTSSAPRGSQTDAGGAPRRVGAAQLAAQRLVERRDRVAGGLVARVGADHHPVGVHEVLDRRALLEELGAGDVGEAGEGAPDRLAGSRRP